MIYAFGVSLPGTYHIKNGIVCQDSHKIIRIGKEVAVAAVADGLGSAAHSDVGSKIAVTVSTEQCRRCLSEIIADSLPASEKILDIIRASFMAAHRAIDKEANSKDRSQDLYDTTLTLAVLIRDTLYYGHSGDSGMIALTIHGSYEKVTNQQQDEQGRVFPLFFSDKWEFAEYGQKVSAVLLATDGMLEPFFPIYIKNEPVKIHVSLAQFFMDYKTLRIVKLGQEAVQTRIKEFMENIPDEQVNDDKTVVVLVNPSVKTKKQPKEYYQEPDWAALKKRHDEEWKRAAYPGLYKDAGEQNQEEPSGIQAKRKPFGAAEDEKYGLSRTRRNTSGRRTLHKINNTYMLLLVVVFLCILATATIVFQHGPENGGMLPHYENTEVPEYSPVEYATEQDEYEVLKKDFKNEITQEVDENIYNGIQICEPIGLHRTEADEPSMENY